MATILPRLLYLGNVPPERSFHGSILLYRLLEHYPADKLLVIEGNLFPSRADRRLPGVRYETLREGSRRLYCTRFARLYRTWLTATAASRADQLQGLVRDFKPEAVLTIPYYFSWITAAHFASQNRLPLHLIVHDEYVDAPFVLESYKPRLRRLFGETYRNAATRLCVSPYMALEYEQKYGAAGNVLYPGRAADAEVFSTLPEKLLQSRDMAELSVAFGGTTGSAGGIRVLAQVAQALQSVKGILKIFGPIDPDRARASGLNASNIQFKGSLNPESFKQALREEADVLLVPMNFSPDDAANARLSFPSKLADYTAVGLPLLIVGPPYCSGVRWAEDNAPVAELVTREDIGDIKAALQRLGCREHRIALAHAAMQKGNEFFGHKSVEKAFHGYLQAYVCSKTVSPLPLVAAKVGGSPIS
ncbi:MAG: hypothetical protein H7X97_09675 [Opitutaceae bacterium]|nr:hypothetical protein [Verrucomicrobiales bacterium]